MWGATERSCQHCHTFFETVILHQINYELRIPQKKSAEIQRIKPKRSDAAPVASSATGAAQAICVVVKPADLMVLLTGIAPTDIHKEGQHYCHI